MRRVLALLLLLPLWVAAQSSLPPCAVTAIKNNCFGEAVFPSGNRYVGEWRDNKPHGSGTCIWAAGGKFVGEYRDGRRKGRGTHVFSNGNQFVGDFERDMFNGPGIEYAPDGSVLRSGIWGNDRLLASQALDPKLFPFMPPGSVASSTTPSVDTVIRPASTGRPSLPPCPPVGARHLCIGEQVLEDGSRYVGEFRLDVFDGFGSLQGPMSLYAGDFKAGKYHGVGVLYTRTGQILGEGRWEQGERVETLSLDRSKYPFKPQPPTAAGSANNVRSDEAERQKLAMEIDTERKRRRELEEQLAKVTKDREAQVAASPDTRPPAPSVPTARDRRIALVVGNAAYLASPLANPVNDASDVAAALRTMGFEVILRTNVTRAQMRAAVRDFGESLRRHDVGLFYFAGHGIESKGRNFLIPVEAKMASEFELEDEAVDANSVLRAMEDAGNPTNIMILDACRDNPFARSWRSASRGLVQMNAPAGSFIAFATAPGSVAADGAGRNGTFTKHLLSSLRQPDLDIDRVFTRVTAAVTQETGKKQVPWKSSSLTGAFSF